MVTHYLTCSPLPFLFPSYIYIYISLLPSLFSMFSLSPFLYTGLRATPVKWRGRTSRCLSSSVRRGSLMSWKLSLHHSPPASAPTSKTEHAHTLLRQNCLRTQTVNFCHCLTLSLSHTHATCVCRPYELLCWCPCCRLSHSQSGDEGEGPLSDKCSRKTLFYLIATLNESFRPDYDFSRTKSHDFSREPSLNWVRARVCAL